jgi:hypothetical protein
MTPSKQHAFIKKVKDITIGSTIALSLFGPAVLLQSCSSNQNDDGDYEEVEVYKKGVKTYISETSKGVFKITKEIETDADSSVAYVTYLDGKQDTLSPRAVKALIDQDVARHPQHIGQSSSLSNALLYGGMGYFLGKTLSLATPTIDLICRAMDLAQIQLLEIPPTDIVITLEVVFGVVIM